MQIAFCDASTDPGVARAADESGLAFAYRRHGPDGGQSAAIIEGWARTEGDILAWLNADDALTPWALKTAAAAFQADPELDVFYGESVIIDADGSTLGPHAAVAPPSDLLLRSCIISQPSCFFRRRAVERIGGLDADRHYTMDWDLWTRMYRDGAKFAHAPDVFSAVLFEKGTKTSSMPLARLREIYSIVSAGAGGYAAAKSAFGFILHHLGAYTPLSGPVKSLRRAGLLPERKAGASGLTGSGRLGETARLPVLNLTDRPQDRLEVRLTGAGAASAPVRAEGREGAGPVAQFVFDPPIAPGEAVSLELSGAQSKAPALLERARWLTA